ncbi:hypothetical protein GW17_00026694 [Ensete ventricosum]|nr:hypothetical protein GW17_00026694 [Ensete ventricosum]
MSKQDETELHFRGAGSKQSRAAPATTPKAESTVNDIDGFGGRLPKAALPGRDPRGGVADEPDTAVLRRGEAVLGADLGVGEHAVAEGEPPGPPPPTIIGPLVEEPGDADVLAIGPRRPTTAPRGIGRQVGGLVTGDAGAIENDAAEGVHRPRRAHCRSQCDPITIPVALDQEIPKPADFCGIRERKGVRLASR